MTKILQKTSIITTASIAVLLGGIFLLADEIKFAEAGITLPPPPPSTVCPEDGTVQHWDKVIFEIVDNAGGKIPDSAVGAEHVFIVNDKANEIINIEQKVIDKIGEKYSIPPGERTEISVEIKDVRYETVTCVKEGPIGPQDDPGPQGPEGPKGDPGSAASQELKVRKISDEDTDISNTKTLKVECNANEVVTGGGFSASTNMHVLYNGPSPQNSNIPTGWLSIGVKENGPTGSMEVHVICAKLVP